MPNKRKRVVLDTNLWISFLISGKFAALDKLLEKDVLIFLFSEELLSEFLNVAKRPKFKKLISEDDLTDIFRLLQHHSEFIHVTSKVSRCRDSKDNFLLALCADGQADFLVTGDADLIVLEAHYNTRIVAFRELIELVDSKH
jgi:hypothetical protein